MHGVIFFAVLFVAKVIGNALSTAKTILIQRSRWIIAGVIAVKKVSLTNKEKRAEFGSTLKDFIFLYKYFLQILLTQL